MAEKEKVWKKYIDILCNTQYFPVPSSDNFVYSIMNKHICPRKQLDYAQ